MNNLTELTKIEERAETIRLNVMDRVDRNIESRVGTYETAAVMPPRPSTPSPRLRGQPNTTETWVPFSSLESRSDFSPVKNEKGPVSAKRTETLNPASLSGFPY